MKSLLEQIDGYLNVQDKKELIEKRLLSSKDIDNIEDLNEDAKKKLEEGGII